MRKKKFVLLALLALMMGCNNDDEGDSCGTVYSTHIKVNGNGNLKFIKETNVTYNQFDIGEFGITFKNEGSTKITLDLAIINWPNFIEDFSGDLIIILNNEIIDKRYLRFKDNKCHVGGFMDDLTINMERDDIFGIYLQVPRVDKDLPQPYIQGLITLKQTKCLHTYALKRFPPKNMR